MESVEWYPLQSSLSYEYCEECGERLGLFNRCDADGGYQPPDVLGFVCSTVCSDKHRDAMELAGATVVGGDDVLGIARTGQVYRLVANWSSRWGPRVAGRRWGR